MARIEVDYNERDEEGRVVARLEGEQLVELSEGQAVSLCDPIDRLWAEATVAWIDRRTRAVGFDVDWKSFVDGGLPQSQPSGNVDSAARLSPAFSLLLTQDSSSNLAFRHRTIAAAIEDRLIGRVFRSLFWFHAHRPVLRDYSIRPVSLEQERVSSPSRATDLNVGWELMR